jgi:Bardet-Biedl syndrome 1 protein
MRFGPYGREEASLVLAYKSGAITIKMLQRQADLEVQSTIPGPPPEQDIPLNVPKKTKLYVEQTQRERDQAIGQNMQQARPDITRARLDLGRSLLRPHGRSLFFCVLIFTTVCLLVLLLLCFVRHASHLPA